ncbi:hypothetical protein ABH922_004046 [Rhodococcus sp. 27YEA15]
MGIRHREPEPTPENARTRNGYATPILARAVNTRAVITCAGTSLVAVSMVSAPDTAGAAFLGSTATDTKDTPRALPGAGEAMLASTPEHAVRFRASDVIARGDHEKHDDGHRCGDGEQAERERYGLSDRSEQGMPPNGGRNATNQTHVDSAASAASAPSRRWSPNVCSIPSATPSGRRWSNSSGPCHRTLEQSQYRAHRRNRIERRDEMDLGPSRKPKHTSTPDSGSASEHSSCRHRSPVHSRHP